MRSTTPKNESGNSPCYTAVNSSDKTRNRQACRDDYVHNVHTAGLHTSDRLLLEAVREVNSFDHAGIRTGDPSSDKRQVQDFTTELRVLE